MRVCDYCSAQFLPATYNNIYCSAECRRLGTNKKLAEKYHKQKDFFHNLDGKCLICKSNLSQYNLKGICSSCEQKDEYETRKNLILRFG